jgi:hypothetical protein
MTDTDPGRGPEQAEWSLQDTASPAGSGPTGGGPTEAGGPVAEESSEGAPDAGPSATAAVGSGEAEGPEMSGSPVGGGPTQAGS